MRNVEYIDLVTGFVEKGNPKERMPGLGYVHGVHKSYCGGDGDCLPLAPIPEGFERAWVLKDFCQ